MKFSKKIGLLRGAFSYWIQYCFIHSATFTGYIRLEIILKLLLNIHNFALFMGSLKKIEVRKHVFLKKFNITLAEFKWLNTNDIYVNILFVKLRTAIYFRITIKKRSYWKFGYPFFVIVLKNFLNRHALLRFGLSVSETLQLTPLPYRPKFYTWPLLPHGEMSIFTIFLEHSFFQYFQEPFSFLHGREANLKNASQGKYWSTINHV